MAERLKLEKLEEIAGLSTCVVSSAIEIFQVRLPNTGFADSSIRSMFADQTSFAGYAVTARIRSDAPPMGGHGYRYVRSDWWNNVLKVPSPRVVVIEDLDKPPGLGAYVGEVNANLLCRLGCVALVTNGGVRDLPEVRATGLKVFAGNVAVSHSYAHIVDFDVPVTLGGLKIEPGDLIHGDGHGVQTIPLEIAGHIPAAAREILELRQRIIALCRSDGFSIEELREGEDAILKIRNQPEAM